MVLQCFGIVITELCLCYSNILLIVANHVFCKSAENRALVLDIYFLLHM